MILLVPEINLLNYPLFLLLSFKCRIKAYRRHPLLSKLKGRISALDMTDYFDWEKCMLIKSETAAIWEKIMPKFPSEKWKMKIDNRTVDFSKKAEQELQKEMESIIFFKYVVESDKGKEDKTCIVKSLRFDYLSRLNNSHKLFSYNTVKPASSVNIFLDRLNLKLKNLMFVLLIGYEYVSGFMRNKHKRRKIRYIYDGISPKELSISENKITFSWLIDNDKIKKKDVVFILPRADFHMRPYAKEYKNDRELLAVSHSSLSRIASKLSIILSFHYLLRILIVDILLSGWRLEDLLLTRYAVCIFRWMPLIKSLKPEVYITTLSTLGIEDPAVAYFNEIGMKTITWAYGTNSYLFCTDDRRCKFKNILFYNMLSSRLIVWNSHFKEFMDEHMAKKDQVCVIGPIMSGDEKVMGADKDTLFEKFKATRDPSKRYITIFDVPPVSRKYRGNPARYPDSNSEEYNHAFMKDMIRLADDLQNIIVLYKPKRSLESGKFSYLNEQERLLKEISKRGKVFTFDYNINPWIPIAVADLCISMPFESPVIAALQHHKIGIFHDPQNIARHHRYADFPELITHSYDSLRSRVKEYLYEKSSIKDIIDEKKLHSLKGRFPGENSSDKFREYLRSL